jgi:hypothetical protein|tara:strand:- start:12116 stop:12322 length:207 start_codon:yes stop_codon:yes gene_type:complete
MKIKIVYTGDPTETKVVNAETGEEIGGIQSIEVSIDAFAGYASIILQDFLLEANNLEGDVVDRKELTG